MYSEQLEQFIVSVKLTLFMLLLFSTPAWSQADYVQKGDYFLKGKMGYEKNEDMAKFCYQLAVDCGDDTGLKRLKKMGIVPPARSSLATQYDSRGYGTSNIYPQDTPDDEVLMVALGRSTDYNTAVDNALKTVIDQANKYAGAGSSVMSYHLMGATDARGTDYVALQVRVKLPKQAEPNASFKVSSNKRKSDIRLANTIESFKELFDILYKCLPYSVKPEVTVKKTAGPDILGTFSINYSNMRWANFLKIIPTLEFTKAEQLKIANCSRVSWNDRTFMIPTQVFTENYNPVFNFSSVERGALYAYCFLSSCLPDYYIVTEETVQAVPLEGLGRVAEASVQNKHASFSNSTTPIETSFTIKCTPIQFETIRTVDYKRLDQLNFGQQQQVLNNFANNYDQKFWKVYNNIYRFNQDYPERLQALNQKKEVANLVIRAKNNMYKGNDIFHNDLSSRKSIASYEGIFGIMDTYISTGTKKYDPKTIANMLSDVVELCNEAIVYYETAQEDLELSAKMQPHQDTNKLIRKCQKEIADLQEKKAYYTAKMKSYKSTKRK